MLLEHKHRQQAEKHLLQHEYKDYGLVIAQNNGRPYERRMIQKRLRELEDTLDVQAVVFHSLRHSSTSMKLKIGGGDIKSVQGDNGHSQASMVTDVYSSIATEDRKHLSMGVDAYLAKLKEQPTQPDNSATAKLLLRIQEDPDKAEKLLAMLDILC